MTSTYNLPPGTRVGDESRPDTYCETVGCQNETDGLKEHCEDCQDHNRLEEALCN